MTPKVVSGSSGLVQEQPNFLIVPGARVVSAEENRCGGAPVYGLLEFQLPRPADREPPLVQERSQASLFLEAFGEQLHLGLVLSFMG